MAKIRICKEEGCHNAQTTGGYCRYHYLRNWKAVKKEEHEKAAKRLNRYISSVCKKNPKKYLEQIKDNINTGKYSIDDQNREDMDDLYRLFNEPSYEEDVERLIKDLKIEKNF